MQEIPSKKRKAKKERECFRIYIIYRGPILASTRLQYQKGQVLKKKAILQNEDECLGKK